MNEWLRGILEFRTRPVRLQEGSRVCLGNPSSFMGPPLHVPFCLAPASSEKEACKQILGRGEAVACNLCFVYFFSPHRKEQLDPAARYVCDHESSSSHHCVGTEGPVMYGLGPLGSRAGHGIEFWGSLWLLDTIFFCQSHVNLLKNSLTVIIAAATF